MRLQILACLLLSFIACDRTKSNSHNDIIKTNSDTSKNHSNIISASTPTFENASPNAKRLMNEEFYFSLTDETGPFGNDDGTDTYAGFQDWRKSHFSASPKEFLFEQLDRWAYPKFDLNELDIKKLTPYLKQSSLGSRYMSGVDAAIIAIAFGQLYLEGTIDKEFNQLAKTAINRELIPEILNLWGNKYKKERAAKLNKMLGVLNQVI